MYELMYYSTAIKSLDSADIADILKTARDCNSSNQLAGCLLYHNNDYIQLLEGKRQVVRDLFANIAKDKRHSKVMLLAEGDKPSRDFKNWSMAFHELEYNEKENGERFLFIKNFTACSNIAEKPTEATRLFFHLSRHLLSE